MLTEPAVNVFDPVRVIRTRSSSADSVLLPPPADPDVEPMRNTEWLDIHLFPLVRVSSMWPAIEKELENGNTEKPAVEDPPVEPPAKPEPLR